MEFPAVPLVAITLSKAGLQVVSSVCRIKPAGPRYQMMQMFHPPKDLKKKQNIIEVKDVWKTYSTLCSWKPWQMAESK